MRFLLSVIAVVAVVTGNPSAALADEGSQGSSSGGSGSEGGSSRSSDDASSGSGGMKDSGSKSDRSPDVEGPSGTEAKPAFQKLDANRDGKISAAEFSKLQGGDLGRLDINGDGSLDRTEYDHTVWQPAGRDRGFDGIDGNRDGRLSRSEAESALGSVDFGKADRNRNGYIDRNEFQPTPRLGAQDPASRDTRRTPDPRDPAGLQDPR
jgi:hypothetical protein